MNKKRNNFLPVIVSFRFLIIVTLILLIPFFSYSQTVPTLPPSNATVCATSGNDGTTNINGSVNTYFPPQGSITLAGGTNSVVLAAVPPTDAYGNNFGNVPIKSGDLLLIIQMQDATINFSNST